jgi:hypothetical protein
MKRNLLTPTLLALTVGACVVASCSTVQKGSDPLVVRTEQLETTAYDTFDTFLKVDDIAMANNTVAPTWTTSAHPFAVYLRQPIQSGTNKVPFGIATILSLDQIKLAYKVGTATSNNLVTAINTLTATISQVSQYTSLISTNK